MPLSEGLQNAIQLYGTMSNLELSRKQIGLREKELENMSEQLELQKKKEAWDKKVSLFTSTAGKISDEWDQEIMNQLADDVGLPKISFGDKIKDARQELTGFFIARQKNPEMDPTPFITSFYGRYGGSKYLSERLSAEQQALESAKLQQADQEIAIELQATQSPQEAIGKLNQIALSDKNPYRRQRAGQLLKEQEAVREVVTPKTQDFGDEREATSSELFGKGFASLVPAQQKAVNAVIQQRKVEVSAAGAAAGAMAKGEAEKDLPLSTEEAIKLGVPYGTTMREAFGIQPLSVIQRNNLTNFASAKAIVRDIGELSEKVNIFDPGFMGMGRAAGTAKNKWGSVTQTNPDVAILQTKAGELSLLVRAMGESGVLATKDVDRVKKLVPNLSDTTEVARRKIIELNEFISDVEEQMFDAITMDIRKFKKEPIRKSLKDMTDDELLKEMMK